MSRVGKKPIELPKGVKVDISGSNVKITGPKGNMAHVVPDKIQVKQESETIVLSRIDEARDSRSLHGLTRALLHNMVVGVSEGFKRDLEIVGVGYKAQMRTKDILSIYVGHSHSVDVFIPTGITATVEAGKGNPKIKLEGCDKQLIGETAAQIRRLRSPEPYKGKGIRYVGEYVRKKVGKAVVGSK